MSFLGGDSPAVAAEERRSQQAKQETANTPPGIKYRRMGRTPSNKGRAKPLTAGGRCPRKVRRRTKRLSSGGRAESLETPRNQNRGRRLLERMVRHAHHVTVGPTRLRGAHIQEGRVSNRALSSRLAAVRSADSRRGSAPVPCCQELGERP